MQSVVCTANTELFHVDNKAIDRLITKKNERTLNLLRQQVEQRLKARSQTQLGAQITLYARILETMEYTKPKRVTENHNKKLQTLSQEEKQKQQTLKQLVKLYLLDRSPLIDPYVPGAAFYKVRAAQHAYRDTSPDRPEPAQSMTGALRLERARKAAKRQPRSRRELERLTIAQDPEEISKLQDRNHAVNRFLQRQPSGTTLPRPKSAMNVADLHEGDPIFELTQPQVDTGEDMDLDDLSEEEVKEMVINLGNTSDMTNATRTRVICNMMEKNAHQSAKAKYKHLMRPTSAPSARMAPDDVVDSGDNSEVFDSETSDVTLRSLEQKIRSFYDTHSTPGYRRMVPQIQRLKRFNIAVSVSVLDNKYQYHLGTCLKAHVVCFHTYSHPCMYMYYFFTNVHYVLLSVLQCFTIF